MPAIRGLTLLVLLAFAAAADSSRGAGVVVDAKSGPWLWVNGGLNTSFQYGLNDQSAPTIVPGLTAGQSISVTYLSGTVQNSPSGSALDANGDLSQPNAASPENSNGAFPGFFAANPDATFAYDLIGTFTDGSGQIVGLPFPIGNGPGPFTVPAGATQLQMGMNDNKYDDNSGSWTLSVTVVPEPSALALLGVGALFFLSRRSLKS